MNSNHINEMSPELLRRAASAQRRQLKDVNYQKSITAYDYLKKLRRIEDFMDYADEIIDKINSGETGTVAGDEEAKKIISQTNANAGLKPVAAVKKSASTPGYPAPVTVKDHKISLKNAPADKKYVRTSDPVINRSNDWDVHLKTVYVVVFISNVDGKTCAVTIDGHSKADAAMQSLQKMWDIEEILNVIKASEYSQYEDDDEDVSVDDNDSSDAYPVIDPAEYETDRQLADACAEAITGGEFDNMRELVADVKIDQATDDSITSKLYEGEDIEGNRWGGRKASVRQICESENYDWTSGGTQGFDPDNADYDVKFITKLSDNGNDEIIDGCVNASIMRQALREGIIHIVFIKSDGSERQAFATTNEKILEMNDALSTSSDTPKPSSRPDHVRFYDMTIRAWRSFLMERLTMVYDETF
jgi:hypothetical protein